ncbi:MAG: LamG domain-containing protein, partial [Candidatus Nanohaloarchaea archaeon]|nr:LamG domain-containing protein [Candidatus Nanohaloarchaea archaeon]
MGSRKAVSPLLSMAFYIAIVLAGVTIVLNVGMPMLERMQETAAIQHSVEQFNELDSVVRTVAGEGRYSSRTFRLSFDRGRITFNNASDSLVYRIKTTSGIISTHTAVRQGEVVLSANAEVEVNRSEVDGIDCYRIVTEELSACVRQVTRGFNASDHPSIVGFWELDGGSGQNVEDSSLYGNDGTRGASTASESSDPSWTSEGVWDSALEFDGSDDNVTVSDSSSLDVSKEISLAAWLNASGAGGDPGKVLRKGDAYGLWANSSYAVFQAGGQNVTASISSGWTHVVGRYNGTFQSLYVDGERRERKPLSGSLSTNNRPVAIGSSYTGALDELRVYNRSLTEEEIDWLHLKEGDEQYVNTSEMVVQLKNRDTGRVLNGTITTFINGSEASASGRGTTSVEELGDHLPRGRVELNITGSGEGSYNVTYELLSGSDFLTVRTEGGMNTSTTEMRYVLTDRSTDVVVIDDSQRSAAVYTDGELDFGYAVSEGI